MDNTNMSVYDKMDETESQAMLEVVNKRKTRKRITIITVSAIVLIGVVCAAVFGTVASKNNNKKARDGYNNSSSNDTVSDSVKAVCEVTLYKEACYASLGSLVRSGKILQPRELFLLSVEVALSEVSNAVKYFFEESGNYDNRTKQALQNCRDHLGLAVDHLNGCLASGRKSNSYSLVDALEDLKTWLSAAVNFLYMLQQNFIL